VEVLKKAIIKMIIITLSMSNLIKSFGNVTLFIKILRSDLSNVQINTVGKVPIKFPKFISFKTFRIDVMFCTNMLVWDDVLRFSVFISWCFYVMNCEVSVSLCLINLKEKVFSSDNLIISFSSKDFLI